MTLRQAHTWMTTAEQVAFAWKYRDRFAEVAEHNSAANARRRKQSHDLPENQLRNAWIELADMPDARADRPTPKPQRRSDKKQIEMFEAA